MKRLALLVPYTTVAAFAVSLAVLLPSFPQRVGAQAATMAPISSTSPSANPMATATDNSMGGAATTNPLESTNPMESTNPLATETPTPGAETSTSTSTSSGGGGGSWGLLGLLGLIGLIGLRGSSRGN
ncbi:MAG TPA: hypothetical protein VFE36_08045 [Candidatus Baltobacteraceae bacterium]|nr:hypothetical protein [Candidatus Baltobacteraceae bacterium]